MYNNLDPTVRECLLEIQEYVFMYVHTVAERMVHTPRFLDLRFGLYSPKYLEHENKWYTIEKPYKIATRNTKKNFEFSKIC